MKHNIEIVCSSYSKNSNLWKQLIKSYEKFAPNFLRNFKFTIITDDIDIKDYNSVNFFRLKKDYGWSGNLIKYLNTISSNYVFVVFDDVFLNKKVDFDLFFQKIKECNSRQISFCRFRNSPLTLKKSSSKHFNLVDSDSPYRTVLSFSLVRKDVLLSLLNSNENAWDFEYNSPIRAKKIQIYETKKNIISYIHVIEKGGYRFSCLFYKQLKEIRSQYDLFIPSPIYFFKIVSGLFFSKLPYTLKRYIYFRFKKLHN